MDYKKKKNANMAILRVMREGKEKRSSGVEASSRKEKKKARPRHSTFALTLRHYGEPFN